MVCINATFVETDTGNNNEEVICNIIKWGIKIDEDIAGIEIFPINVVGLVIAIIFVIIAFIGGGSVVGYLGLILGSIATGFLCKNSTMYAVIYGALIGIIDSLFIGLISGIFSMFILTIVLGIFGAFVGKFIQSRVV